MKLEKSQSVAIIYSMINAAFGLPVDTKHKLATLKHGRDVFLEIDDLPDQASPRPRHDGYLAPCVAIGSFIHPNFTELETVNKNDWITSPAVYNSIVYDGKPAATLKAPDGTLVELVGI